jgi:hypothetical protein
MRHVDPQRHRAWFAVGVALVVLNVPLGWIGGLVCAALAAEQRDPRWLWRGAAIYAFSWVLLGVGVLISGKAGVTRAREILRRRRRLREILQFRRRRRAANAAPQTPTP